MGRRLLAVDTRNGRLSIIFTFQIALSKSLESRLRTTEKTIIGLSNLDRRRIYSVNDKRGLSVLLVHLVESCDLFLSLFFRLSCAFLPSLGGEAVS